MPSRRSILATVVAGSLAGCLGQSSDRPTGDGDRSADEESPADGTETVGALAEQFDCEAATRPDCDVPAGEEIEWEHDDGTTVLTTVGTADYPAPPEAFTATDVRSFVREHELAYARNEAVCRRASSESAVVSASATTQITHGGVRTYDWYEDVRIVRVDYMLSTSSFREGFGLSEADAAPSAAVYAVDETAAVRVWAEGAEFAADPLEAATPDPVTEGDLVVCF